MENLIIGYNNCWDLSDPTHPMTFKLSESATTLVP